MVSQVGVLVVEMETQHLLPDRLITGGLRSRAGNKRKVCEFLTAKHMRAESADMLSWSCNSPNNKDEDTHEAEDDRTLNAPKADEFHQASGAN
jgi:hypothetical protein